MVAVVACEPPAQLTLSDNSGSAGSFLAGVWRLLDRLDCRRADTTAERDAIFRLRYRAYLRESAILPNSSKSFSDRYDDMDNVYLFGLYVDGALASSIRIQIVTGEHPYSPSLDAFGDVLQPELDAGKVVVDSSRFVTDERLSRSYRGLPYVTTRLSYLAGLYFNADHFLAAVRSEHQAFYRRTYQHRSICEPRPYPQLTKPLCLMTTHCASVANAVQSKYPFFRSTFFERRMLFERTPALAAHETTLAPDNCASFDERSASRLAG